MGWFKKKSHEVLAKTEEEAKELEEKGFKASVVRIGFFEIDES